MVADVADDQGVEGAAVAAGEAALVEDVGDLAVRVVVQKPVDLGDGVGWGLAEFPGVFGHREHEAVVGAAAQADVCGDLVGGSGHGDVGEEQSGDAFALSGWGGWVVPDCG